MWGLDEAERRVTSSIDGSFVTLHLNTTGWGACTPQRRAVIAMAL